MVKKKLLPVIAILIVVAFLAGGCGTGEQDQGEGAPTETTDEIKQLIVAVDPDYNTFDPGLAYELYGMMVLNPVYETLVHFVDTIDVPKYGIAESHEVSEDGLVYTFKLRPGINFASGNPLTSEDVKWSIERMISLDGNGAFMAKDIASIEAPDDETVIITLTEPDASFLVKLTYNAFAAIDSALAMEHGASNDAQNDTAKLWFDNNSAGSGPYMIESYDPAVEVVLVRNDNYWGEAPYYDRISLKSIADPGTQLMMLQKGDIDIAFNLGPEHVKQLSGVEGVDILSAQSMTISFLLMNRDPAVGGPMANPDVQKAVRLALDYKEIQALAGEGAVTPVAPFQIGFLGTVPPRDPNTARDVEAAQALMEQAGYPEGFSVTLEVPTVSVEGLDLPTLAQKIQNDLLDIGITTEIVTSDIMVALDPYRSGQQAFSLWYWGPDYPDPNNQLAFLPGNSVGLRANWTTEMNPELAELGRKTAVEVDPDIRAQYLEEIQMMMDDDTAFAMLLQFARQFAVRDNIEGADYIDPYRIDLRQVREK